MYLRVTNRKNGKYMTIYEKFWDKEAKVARDRAVLTPGYVNQYLDQYTDPVAHFKQVAAELTEQQKVQSSVSINIDLNQTMDTDTDNLKNIGYLVFKRIYFDLELDTFWKRIALAYGIEFDLEKIFRLLVFARLLFPASKKRTYQDMHKFYESFGVFSLDDVYHALDIFGKYENDLQAWIFEHSKKSFNRDVSIGFFDCTNYYYDISKPDTDEYDDDGNLVLKRYRKYGPEKNHRKDPIVELGLLMDHTGIPLAYDLFPGNESEKVNMLPIINRARNNFNFSRIIVVADRGLNTADNIYKLNGDNKGKHNDRDGYVYGQSVRGADAEFKEWVLDQTGYINTKIENGEQLSEEEKNDLDDDSIFRHKSRIYPKVIQVNYTKENGKQAKKKKSIDQKQLVYYSAKYAKKQKLERDRAVERAKDLINHPKKYDKVSAKGASGYVLNISFNKETGEVVDKNLVLDEDKIREEEKYDGYYSIVTSELKMSDIEIRNTYKGLAKIENTFRITKSELDTRPIYVRTNDHIDAHFTTCFTAIVLIRLLQQKLDNKYPAAQLLESLKRYSCVHIDKNHYKFVYYDKIIEECGKVIKEDLNKEYRTSEQMRRLLKF